MNCVSCGLEMSQEKVAGVALDRCGECGGFWFDAGEMNGLVPLLAQNPDVPNMDLSIIHEEARTPVADGERNCPACHTSMNAFNYCYDSNIMLDRCPSCKGVWMDGGELEKVIQYVKGHPKLDKMGDSIARHVHRRMEAEFPDEPRSRQFGLVPALFDIFLRWGR